VYSGGLLKLKVDWAGDACLNVNFPDVPAERAGPLTVTRQGQGLMKAVEVVTRIDPRGADYSWLHITRGQHADAIGSETEVIDAGGIAVTPLQFERTARAGLVAADRGADQLGRQGN
jgi:5'-nucleotidase